MKLVIVFIAILTFTLNVDAQNVNFPDENFKQYLIQEGVDTNDDGEIQVSEAEIIDSLNINDDMIFSIEGIKSFINLRVLQLDIPNVNLIDISGLAFLERLAHMSGLFSGIRAEDCISLLNLELGGESYELLDFTGCISLQSFEADFNIFHIDLVNCTNLESIYLNSIDLMGVDVTGCESLRFIEGYIIGPGSYFEFTNLPVLDTIILFTTQNSGLNLAQLPSLTYLQVESLTDLTVRDCPALEEITINSEIINLDIIELDNLTNVNINSVSNSESISIIDCKNLLNLNIESASNIISLDLSGCSALQNINTGTFFDIGNLILKDCSSIENLEISNFFINPYCDFSGMSSLKSISFEAGPSEIKLDGCYNLGSFTVLGFSSTKVYDFSNCTSLYLVDLGDPFGLEDLILQNGSMEMVGFNSVESLQNVCVDADEFIQMENYLSTFEENEAEITVSCDFVDSGKPFKIFGTSYFDINNDSCKTSDIALPYSRYALSTELNSERTFFTNQDGQYDYNVNEGQYSFGPDLLFGDYIFSTLPENRMVSFPADGTAVNQDFCFIASPEEVDIIEVNLMPIEAARPGFDARYLITYTNTGNVTRGGEIKLTFQDQFMDFLDSEPMVDVQEDGFLSWSFEDLAPFESSSIEFTMNLNSPMDDPALNGDDVLNFRAEVGPFGNQTLTVYWSILNQNVVNSFDPNDKTCLSGNAFDQELVGDYLKYMIRFENTGTAEAVNIVVTDTLDNSKFDPQTLQVINASHQVETKLVGNVVKFIFKDIYLPFEDETNDGYVTFKIKTLPTLQLGDDVQNTAEIFFDFNFPIVTNTTSTVISDFTSVIDNDTKNFDFLVSPNPTFESVLIKSEIHIREIELIDVKGNLIEKIVLTAENSQYLLQIDHLSSGVYFIKATTSARDFSIEKIVVK